MRLPSHVLMKLCLASTTAIGCEPAHQESIEPTAIERSDESLYDQFRVLPAVAPRYAQPQPQQQQQPQPKPQPKQQPQPQPKPQPKIKPQPKPPRLVQESSCGHLLPLGVKAIKKCGKG